ncbi:MAG: aminoacyl-tRNA hydrolase [Planctomycetota bacterium]|jgi:PTH1 family peptidyl-tRNA hydrolase
MSETRLVVGLGNPGAEYAGTRHNVGFRVVDSLAEVFKIAVKKKKFGAVYGAGKFADKKLILLKPWQFMNCSGQAVVAAVSFYRLELDDLLVITDDMALEPGRIRIRSKGSSGGHKGLADIIEKLGTEEVGRLRIGIGQSGVEDAVEFVLDQPTEVERAMLDEAVVRAREAVLCWIEYGIETAMNRFN